MYSRNYYGETEEKPKLPANYDGTAFASQESGEIRDTGATEADAEAIAAHSEGVNGVSQKRGGILSGLSHTLLGGLLDGGGLNIKMPKIGVEEILIIATAAFLLFSKDGDVECAILLLLLLLIN